MSKSKTRRKARRSHAGAARARQGHVPKLYAGLSPAQMEEAHGYLLEAIALQIDRFSEVLIELRAELAERPPAEPGTLEYARTAELESQIINTQQANVELGLMGDSVRARRRFSVGGALGIHAVRSRRYALIERCRAERVPVPADELAECRRREQMIAQWLMDYEPAKQ